PEADARIARPHERQAGAKIIEFAAAIVPRAFARPDAAEVESQHGAADPRECLRGLIDDLRMHRAAVLRMRMRDDDSRSTAVGTSSLDESFVVHAAIRRRFFEQSFETSGRAGDFAYARRHATSVRAAGGGNAAIASANVFACVIDPMCPVPFSTMCL